MLFRHDKYGPGRIRPGPYRPYSSVSALRYSFSLTLSTMFHFFMLRIASIWLTVMYRNTISAVRIYSFMPFAYTYSRLGVVI